MCWWWCATRDTCICKKGMKSQLVPLLMVAALLVAMAFITMLVFITKLPWHMEKFFDVTPLIRSSDVDLVCQANMSQLSKTCDTSGLIIGDLTVKSPGALRVGGTIVRDPTAPRFEAGQGKDANALLAVLGDENKGGSSMQIWGGGPVSVKHKFMVNDGGSAIHGGAVVASSQNKDLPYERPKTGLHTQLPNKKWSWIGWDDGKVTNHLSGTSRVEGDLLVLGQAQFKGDVLVCPPNEDCRKIRDGKDGRDGTNGKDGSNGRDGRDGNNGKDGTNGRDGADCDCSKATAGQTATVSGTPDTIHMANAQNIESSGDGWFRFKKDGVNQLTSIAGDRVWANSSFDMNGGGHILYQPNWGFRLMNADAPANVSVQQAWVNDILCVGGVCVNKDDLAFLKLLKRS